MSIEMSPLDRTLEKVGMGTYQWKLLILCGFGWLSDNMWLQSVAIVLPRVQIHFDISDRWIGLLSTSIFSGMMLGAWLWGSFSDSHGRRNPFNGTLFITALFGLLSGFATSFKWLCFSLFCLGIGVGGSMPTDGTLFLENIPKTRHYLLTALSTFFSLGSVIASLLGLAILPRWSCPEPAPGQSLHCDLGQQNPGWRYMLIVLGLVTFTMFITRVTFFKIEESPKYLMASGRSAEAIVVLEAISAQNGDHLTILESDVVDDLNEGLLAQRGNYSTLASQESPRLANTLGRWSEWRLKLGRATEDNSERVHILLSPEWRVTTTLIWAIWTIVSFGYTSFNVFLPAYLEQRNTGKEKIHDTLKEYMLYTISGSVSPSEKYKAFRTSRSLMGPLVAVSCPGSLLATWMIETRLGRKKTMVLTTLGTGLSVLGFLKIKNGVGSQITNMLVSFLATIMYAVIYSYTPEVFPSYIRGTGYGIASALSRVSGMIAPLIAGQMIKIWNIQSVLWMAVLAFLWAAILMTQLPLETKTKQVEMS